MSYTNYFVTTVSQTNNYKHNIKDINKNHKNFKNNLRSAVYKSNFGSIPAKYENFLLTENEIDKNDNKRFSDRNSIFCVNEVTPGVGTYNLNKSYENLQPKGINFNSKEERFNNNLNHNNSNSEFDLNLSKNILNNDKNNFRYKNLFIDKKTYNYNESDNIPGSNYYNPYEFENKSSKQTKKFNFGSYSQRGNFFNIIENVPCPGEYYPINENFVIKKNIKSNKNINSNNNSKKDNNINKYLININKYPYKLFNNKNGKIYKNQEISNIYKNENLIKNEELYEKVIENLNKNKYYFPEGKNTLLRYKIKEEQELEYIKYLMGNDGKPDKFSLYEERWK